MVTKPNPPSPGICIAADFRRGVIEFAAALSSLSSRPDAFRDIIDSVYGPGREGRGARGSLGHGNRRRSGKTAKAGQ